MLYDIVRKLAEGAQVAAGDRRRPRAARWSRRAVRASRCRRLPETDFPDLAAGELPHRFKLAAERPEAADRQDPVRDLDRRDALLPERHLSARRRREGRRSSARSRPTAIAWPRSRSPRPKGADGMPGIIVPRKTVAEVQRLLEDAGDEVEVELSPTKIRFTLGKTRADLEADRRHLPGLRAGDPGRQRQDAGGRERRVRRRGRPRLDRVERAGRAP